MEFANDQAVERVLDVMMSVKPPSMSDRDFRRGQRGLATKCVEVVTTAIRDCEEAHSEFINKILENTSEDWDGDIAADFIAVQYIQHLENEVKRLGGSFSPPEWFQR